MTDLLIRARQATEHQSVASLDHDGQRVWAKRRDSQKKTIWHRLQNTVATVLGMPILKASVITDPLATQRQEAKRLALFASHGIPVPQIVAQDGNLLVTTDAGLMLKQLLQPAKDPEREHLLYKALDALTKLHAAGLCHGRPFLRDMTWQNDRIHFIDLEENPLDVMSLSQAQARDVWLFFNDLPRYTKNQPDVLDRLFKHYRQQAAPDVLNELARMVRMLKPIRMIVGSVVAPFAGRDVKNAVLANKVMEQIL